MSFNLFKKKTAEQEQEEYKIKAQRQYEQEEAKAAELRILRNQATKAESNAKDLRESRELRGRIRTAKSERFKPVVNMLSGFAKTISKAPKSRVRLRKRRAPRRATSPLRSSRRAPRSRDNGMPSLAFGTSKSLGSGKGGYNKFI